MSLKMKELLEVRKRIFIDMDGVIANIIEKWIITYNERYDDDLKLEDIKSWDLSQAVKPEAKKCCNDIFKIEGFYRDLPIIGNCVEVIRELKEELEYEVFILTDPFTKYSLEDKWDWLQEHLPFIDTRHYIFTGNKSIAGEGFLIDDGLHNLEVFQGVGLLYDAVYNRCNTDYYRINNWDEALNFFRKIELCR